MIDEALVFLKDDLIALFEAKSGSATDGTIQGNSRQLLSEEVVVSVLIASQ